MNQDRPTFHWVLKEVYMEGWHGYRLYIDMDDFGSIVFLGFCCPYYAGLSGLDQRLGFVYRPSHDYRHDPLCRS